MRQLFSARSLIGFLWVLLQHTRNTFRIWMHNNGGCLRRYVCTKRARRPNITLKPTQKLALLTGEFFVRNVSLFLERTESFKSLDHIFARL